MHDPMEIIPASPSARSWAYLLDASLVAVLAGGLTAWLGNLYLAGILSWLLTAVYFVGQQSTQSGATLGQKLLKIRTVNILGEQLSVGRALIRHLAFCLPFLPMTIFELTPAYIHSMEQASGLLEFMENPEKLLEQAGSLINPATQMDMWLSGLGGALSVIFVLPMFFRRDRATLYDLLSDTRIRKIPA